MAGWYRNSNPDGERPPCPCLEGASLPFGRPRTDQFVRSQASGPVSSSAARSLAHWSLPCRCVFLSRLTGWVPFLLVLVRPLCAASGRSRAPHGTSSLNTSNDDTHTHTRKSSIIVIMMGCKSSSSSADADDAAYTQLPRMLAYFHGTHRSDMAELVESCADAADASDVHQFGRAMGQFAWGLDAHHRIEGTPTDDSYQRAARGEAPRHPTPPTRCC